MLEDLKILLGVTNKDDLLNLLIRKSETFVKNECRIEEIPESLRDTVTDIAVIMYNRQGTEGVSSESFSGISTNYDLNLPINIRKALNRHRRLF